jgi:hypothetical protein
VVERTFATRPLVLALHRTPPHVVLVLHPTCAHLYAAGGGGLQPVDRLDTARLDEGRLRAVDRMLGDYRADHPSPLVLVGPPALLDRFCAVSRHLERLAGRVPSDAADDVLDLARACSDTVERYLRGRRQYALEQLGQALRSRPADVAAGIEDCWRSLHARAPGLLLVEESFVSPGVAVTGTTHGGATVTTEVVHDLVDDLIELVILRGGQLALVRDDDLADLGRVALVSRARRQP